MALNYTIGREYSNSFVSLAEANNIISTCLPYSTTEWDALVDVEKEYRLRLAAEMLGVLPFKGIQAFENQALCFPRDCQTDMMIIPQCVKNAQVDLAITVINKNLANLPDNTQLEESGRISNISLGGLLKISFDGKPATMGNVLTFMSKSIYTPVFLELKRYLTSVRGGFICDTDDIFFHTLSSTTTTTTTSTSTSSSTSSSTTTTV